MLAVRQRARQLMERQPQDTSIDRIALASEPVIPDFRGLTSPDGAITLMLSDIADAASIAERLGSDRWGQLLSDHHALVEQVLTNRDGQLARVERDGFFASFNSAHAGLLAAVELQRSFTDLADAAGEPSVSLRIGAHSGFVIAAPDEPQGRNVVLAARIAARAKGGEILVSSSLKQYTERDPRFRFEQYGEYHFKGLVGEHVLYSVAWR
jgi:eukaryotic-like serine/threonine-protein kinase